VAAAPPQRMAHGARIGSTAVRSATVYPRVTVGMWSWEATDRTRSAPAMRTTRCSEAEAATAFGGEEPPTVSEANGDGIPSPEETDVIISGEEVEATAASADTTCVAQTRSMATEGATATRAIAAIIFDPSRYTVRASR
jgi:hypothetical protein